MLYPEKIQKAGSHMERISNYQLFTITVFFQVGTTIVFGFASGAGRDAWLAVLISSFLGMIIMLMYLLLMRMQPGLTLIEWYPAQLGRWLGGFISWLYVLEFIYDAGRGIADVKYLIPTTILPETPTWVIGGVFIIVVAYGVSSGIEIIGRMGEMGFPIIIALSLLEMILLFSSGVVHTERLQPVLYEGWGEIWKSVWPTGATQSFGESIELAMIWTLTRQPERVMKTTILAIICSAIFIGTMDALAVAVLGEGVFQRSMYPMYLLIRQINVADFVTNMDAIGILFFCGLLFMKLSIHMFVAIRSIQLLTSIQNSRILVLPVSIIVFLIGIKMDSNSVKHIYDGVHIVPTLLWVPLFIILPSTLLFVTWIRKMWTMRRQASS
ncbi:spore germination protein [Ectobacillus funiculus]|uniref:GerAB/ArcD/ProY family transporter n=1 Tax=Ectobacillus funiculus TaxID=137993 RepID=UPI003978A46E